MPFARPVSLLVLSGLAATACGSNNGRPTDQTPPPGTDSGTSTREGGTSNEGGGRQEGGHASVDGSPASGPPPNITVAVAAGFTVASEVTYPVVPLRGYGALGGVLDVFSGGEGGASALSALGIAATDSAQASLTLAKYLSDLQSLDGVTSTNLSGVPAWSVPGGTVVAFSSGSSVFVISGSSSSDVLAESAAQTGPHTYTSSATVPMYLDRWDKHGFNFYYAPWTGPANYDYTQDFDYSKQHGGTGFVIWSSPFDQLDAEGQMNDGSNSWVIQSAASRGLPVIFNNDEEYNLPDWMISQFRGAQYNGANAVLLERAPGFSGTPLGGPHWGEAIHGWGGGVVEEALYGVLQAAVNEYAEEPNVVSILEPHGEMIAGPGFDLLGLYGPAGDLAFQTFLKTRYSNIQAVNTAWYGASGTLTSWSDVHAPELTSFVGHDTTAFDIAGTWRVLPSQPAGSPAISASWSTTTFDDSAWALLPNDDSRGRLPIPSATTSSPTYLRTQFTPTGSGYSWLYVWPLGTSCPSGQAIEAFLNGTQLTATSTVPASQALSWSAFKVEGSVTGSQTLALSIPPCTGDYVFSYQTYLSKTAPALFPNFSATENQRWIDFSDWYANTRQVSIAGGMNMIRQVDRNKPIELMAPNQFIDVNKIDAENYGGTFHDTGFMSGFWIDVLPAEMRSAGRPFSAEPGGPASDAATFQQQFSHWLTEGVSGINYFSNLDDVTGNPQIKAVYEAWQPMLGTVGKYHGAPTDVAQLFSPRTFRLEGWPWAGDPNVDINGGATSAWALGEALEDQYDLDAITEADFALGNASQYRVIIDANTSFMDDTTVASIKSWIEDGGTFVTYIQTGRNSPAGTNTWPISQLTGYTVASIDPGSLTAYEISTACASGSTACVPGFAVSEVTGQKLLPSGSWTGSGVLATGLHLKNAGMGADDVLKYSDGTIAVGVRTLGLGKIVTLGGSFVTNEGWRGNSAATTKLMKQLIAGAGAVAVPGCALAATAPSSAAEDGGKYDGGNLSGNGCATAATSSSVSFTGANHFRHFVSNNGLYDVWVLAWDGGTSGTATVDVNLVVQPASGTGASAAVLPTEALDVMTSPKTALPMENHGTFSTLTNIVLAPNDVRMFLTARNGVAQAPRTWFELQRGWWAGTTAPTPTPPPAASHRYTLDLSASYPMGENGSAPGWSKTFQVPTTWTGGTKELWVSGGVDPAFLAEGSASLDGKSVWPLAPSTTTTQDTPGIDVTATLTAGTNHTFATTVQAGGDTISGVRGEAWIEFIPTPAATQNLAGSWATSNDGFSFSGAPITLPGAWETAAGGGIAGAQTTATVPSSWSGTDVVLAFASAVGLGDVIVNGQWIHAADGWLDTQNTVRVNVTPYIIFGATNTFALFPFGGPGSACKQASCVTTLELESFPAKGIYP